MAATPAATNRLLDLRRCDLAHIVQPAYIDGMQTALTYALYITIAVLFVVLAVGIANLLRTDEKAKSRSNKLMRLRVAVQFVAILILVGLGALAGAFR